MPTIEPDDIAERSTVLDRTSTFVRSTLERSVGPTVRPFDALLFVMLAGVTAQSRPEWVTVLGFASLMLLALRLMSRRT
jgi:hypothetical protein